MEYHHLSQQLKKIKIFQIDFNMYLEVQNGVTSQADEPKQVNTGHWCQWPFVDGYRDWYSTAGMSGTAMEVVKSLFLSDPLNSR